MPFEKFLIRTPFCAYCGSVQKDKSDQYIQLLYKDSRFRFTLYICEACVKHSDGDDMIKNPMSDTL